ncbi:hypothetical protein DIPPA_55124 [Diplonema papillatum]|nr:hypothetical protein DIPPA_55124 [Diplonema papillatum]
MSAARRGKSMKSKKAVLNHGDAVEPTSEVIMNGAALEHHANKSKEYTQESEVDSLAEQKQFLLEASNKALTQRVKDLQEQIEKQSAELSESEENLFAQQALLDDKERQVISLQADLDDKEARLCTVLSTQEEMSSALSAAKDLEALFQERLRNVVSEYETKICSLEEKLCRKARLNETLQSHKSELEHTVGDQIVSLRDLMEEVQKENIQLTRQKLEVEEHEHEVAMECEMIKNKLKGLEAELEQTCSALQTKSSAFSSLSTEFDLVSQNCKMLQNKLETGKQQLECAHREGENQKKKLDKLEASLRQSRSVNDQLEAVVREIKYKIASDAEQSTQALVASLNGKMQRSFLVFRIAEALAARRAHLLSLYNCWQHFANASVAMRATSTLPPQLTRLNLADTTARPPTHRSEAGCSDSSSLWCPVGNQKVAYWRKKFRQKAALLVSLRKQLRELRNLQLFRASASAMQLTLVNTNKKLTHRISSLSSEVEEALGHVDDLQHHLRIRKDLINRLQSELEQHKTSMVNELQKKFLHLREFWLEELEKTKKAHQHLYLMFEQREYDQFLANFEGHMAQKCILERSLHHAVRQALHYQSTFEEAYNQFIDGLQNLEEEEHAGKARAALHGFFAAALQLIQASRNLPWAPTVLSSCKAPREVNRKSEHILSLDPFMCNSFGTGSFALTPRGVLSARGAPKSEWNIPQCAHVFERAPQSARVPHQATCILTHSKVPSAGSGCSSSEQMPHTTTCSNVFQLHSPSIVPNGTPMQPNFEDTMHESTKSPNDPSPLMIDHFSDKIDTSVLSPFSEASVSSERHEKKKWWKKL